MMRGAYDFEVLKRNFQLLLVSIAIISSVMATIYTTMTLNKLKNPILIAIDTNGTRLVSRLDDPIFDTEMVQFMRKFFAELYNFDPATFTEHVGGASSMMSEKLWKNQKDKLLKLKSEVAKNEIHLEGFLRKLTKTTQGQYMALIATKQTSRLQNSEQELIVEFQVARTTRNEINPWGLEIIKYEETVAQ